MLIKWKLIDGAIKLGPQMLHISSRYSLFEKSVFRGLKEVTMGNIEVKQVQSTEYNHLMRKNKIMENKLDENGSTIEKIE